MSSIPPGLLSRVALAGAFLLLVTVVVAGAATSAQAPRRPPEPFPVFVHPSDPDDEALRVDLEAAALEIRDQVRRRRDWFRVVDSSDEAAITLRITNYRMSEVMLPKLERLFIEGRVVLTERSEIVEFHYVDAVALAGVVRGNLTGMDERERGSSLRNAASHLAEELNDFARTTTRR